MSRSSNYVSTESDFGQCSYDSSGHDAALKISQAIYRNPLKENYTIEHLITLVSAQPLGIKRKATNVIVGGKVKSLKLNYSFKA